MDCREDIKKSANEEGVDCSISQFHSEYELHLIKVFCIVLALEIGKPGGTVTSIVAWVQVHRLAGTILCGVCSLLLLWLPPKLSKSTQWDYVNAHRCECVGQTRDLSRMCTTSG